MWSKVGINKFQRFCYSKRSEESLRKKREISPTSK